VGTRINERSQRLALERSRGIVKSVAADRGLTFTERVTPLDDVTRDATRRQDNLLRPDRRSRYRTRQARSRALAPGSHRKPPRQQRVDRGAPRDFTDIHAVITANVLSIDEAWAIWQQRNPRLDVEQAKAQVLKHLESIAARRPLDTLATKQRDTVGEARRWFREELTRDPARKRRGAGEDRGSELDL
jgi:hypothetical protein